MYSERDRKGAWKLAKTSIFIILVLWSITQVFPVIWMYYNSVKSRLDIIRYPLRLPEVLHFENYWMSWTGITEKGLNIGVNIGLYYKNSIIVVFSSLFILIIVSTLAGYAVGRYQFWGRKALLLLFVSVLIMPPHALIVPLYLQIKSLNLINRYLGLILVYVAHSLAFSVLLMQAYFRGFPSELEDAARIDGCSELGILWRVVIPISKGLISVIAIVNFSGLWNELLFSLIILWRNDVKTLPPGLLGYVGIWGQVEWGLIFAGLSITAAPVIIFYLIFHRNIMRDVTLGSIKG